MQADWSTEETLDLNINKVKQSLYIQLSSHQVQGGGVCGGQVLRNYTCNESIDNIYTREKEREICL